MNNKESVCGPRLVCLSGPIKGKSYRLDEAPDQSAVVLGSQFGVDFWISGSTVQARHAVIERQGGEWVISALSQDALLKVNDEPVLTAVIEDGDKLQVGRHLLGFWLDPAPLIRKKAMQ